MLLSIRVIPRSTRNTLEWEQDIMKARLTAPPVDGAANDALIALLAERLAIPKRSIAIVRGSTSRKKIVELEGITLEEVKRKLL